MEYGYGNLFLHSNFDFLTWRRALALLVQKKTLVLHLKIVGRGLLQK